MAKKKNKGRPYDYKNVEVQEAGNNLLRTAINELRHSLTDVFWSPRGEEDQYDKGIDFQYEVVDKTTRETIHIFKIQNKGTDTPLTVLKTTENKGFISFPLKIRNAKYYRYEIPIALIFTVCDVASKKVYWHPVQLDDDIDRRIEEAEKKKQDYITIYIDSNNVLDGNTVKRFMQDVNESFKEQSQRFQKHVDHPLLRYSEPVAIVIDKSKTQLEQLHDYISVKFKEVNYIPIHLLTRCYPFKKEDSFFPYYAIFSLTTDNEELFEFFESIKIEKNGELTFTKKELIKGVKKHKEKTRTVLSKLSKNLIFNLESKKSHKRINIHFTEEQRCDCVGCKFFRFEFSEAFKELSTVPENLDEKYKLAYVQYQIGNFLKAEKLLSKLVNQNKSKHLNIRQFIAQYNLNKLSIFIRDRYWGENAQDALVDKLKEINLNKLFQELKNDDNEKLLDWIRSNSFYSKSRDRIQKAVAKIREHYYIQLKGGWSSNNHIWELINEYAEIDAFLNNNYIIYDGFSEFRELTEAFIEGLFASHAIDKTQNSRLENFDDWLIKKIVFYGKAERILKHFEWYGLKEIVYKQTSIEGDSFVELLSRFLDGNTKTRRAFNQYCEKNNRYFWEKYNSIFSNLMVMAGISDLKKAQVNKIAGKLLKFLGTEKFIYPYSIRYARFFINRKSHLINKSTLKKFLLITINNGKLHGKDFIKTLAKQIKRHHGKIKLAANDYTGFEKMAFDKCPICKRKHSANFMVYLYEVIGDEKTRDKIKLGIEESLKNKYSTELYSLSAIFGILEAKGDFFEQFIQASKPAPNQPSIRSIFTGKDEIRHPNLNMLINLCYKYAVDLGKKKFEDFKGIDAYYDWLLDMKHFDYSLFNPKWVSEYKTLYYSMEIRKYKIIQEKICEYLEDNSDPQLERDYIDLFCNDKG